MKNLTFILVLKFDTNERKNNTEIVNKYIKSNFPQSAVIIKHREETPFHRTRYINEALLECKTPYAAVWDVDILLNPVQVREAVKLAVENVIVYPYTLPWCNVFGEGKLLSTDDLMLKTMEYTDKQIKVSVGGVYICNVEKWRVCGWENENFIDWGPEDRERYFRCKILTGQEPPRVEGPIFHLDHPRIHEKTWAQPYYGHNAYEFRRISSMTLKELTIEIGTRAWLYGEHKENKTTGARHVVTRLGIEDDKRSGRLGNKMFMAAACIGYAESRGAELVLPEWKLKDIFTNIHTEKNLESVYNNISVWSEPGFAYSVIPDMKRDVSLGGYFQSEKYFEHCADKIRSHYFKPDIATAKYAETVYNKLSDNGKLRLTVIQVRRDDYLKNPQYHSVQTIGYYETAIDILKEYTDKFVVFCDITAEQWCRQVFDNMGIAWEFAPHDNYIGDIFVMSKCNNYIIANSTFGWWGAWLNPHQDKIQVIAPKRWFGPNAQLDDRDLIPERWKRI